MQKEIRAHFSALCCLTRVAFVVLYTTIFLARSNECIVHTIFGQNSLIVLSTLAWPCAVLCCSVSICTNIFVYFRTEKKLASWRGHVAAHLFIFASNLKHSCQYWKMLTLFLALHYLVFRCSELLQKDTNLFKAHFLNVWVVVQRMHNRFLFSSCVQRDR